MIQVMLFLHVAGALGLTAAFGVEGLGVWGLRRSSTSEEAELWIATRRWVLVLGPASIGLVLVTGVYLSAVAWGSAGWIVVSVVTLVVLAAVGGLLTGVPMARAEAALRESAGAVTDGVRRLLRAPLLTTSLLARVFLTLAVAFLMVAKPSAMIGAAAVAGFGIVGAAIGWAVGARR